MKNNLVPAGLKVSDLFGIGFAVRDNTFARLDRLDAAQIHVAGQLNRIIEKVDAVYLASVGISEENREYRTMSFELAAIILSEIIPLHRHRIPAILPYHFARLFPQESIHIESSPAKKNVLQI